MTPTPMAATATATKPETDDFLPTSSATPSLPNSSPLSHTLLCCLNGARGKQQQQRQQQRVIIIISIQGTTRNVPARSRLATYPQKLQLRGFLSLPSFPPLSSSSSFPSQSLYCRSAAVVVYFSLELSLECCQRKCAYVAAAAAVPSCSSSGSSPCSSSTCGMPQTPANQKLLLFSATIPAPLHSPQLLPPLAAAVSCCCHIMEMSSCSPLRFHKRVDLQPFNTSDDPEHATTETTTNIPLSYLQQAVAPSTTSVALNVQCATCGTAAASAQLS